MKKLFTLIIIIAALIFPAAANAEGFGVYEWSAPGTSMGDNFMFDDEDASVLAYNPSGITNLKGKNLSFGATWFNPAIKTQFNNGPLNRAAGYGATSNRNNNYDPIWGGSVFYTQQLSDKHWVGIGVFPRYGNAISFNSGWEGRYDNVNSKIVGITIQPTWAFKPHKKWSIALGLDIDYMNLMMEKSLPGRLLGMPGDIGADLDGRCTDIGWLVSAMYDFDKKTSAALTYRSSIKHTMDADVDVSVAGAKMPTKAHGSVTVPDSVALGVGHKFNDRTRIEFDATWTNWTTYDKLNMTIDPTQYTGSLSLNSEKDWNAVWRLGIGLKHKINDKWTFLCGYNYDMSPVPDNTMDFTVPTGNRHRGSLGFTYHINKDAAVTFGYTAIWAASRDVYSKLGSLNPALSGLDFTSAHVNDCLTQILSLGFTVKLK